MIANLGIESFIVKGVIVGVRDKQFPWPTQFC